MLARTITRCLQPISLKLVQRCFTNTAATHQGQDQKSANLDNYIKRAVLVCTFPSSQSVSEENKEFLAFLPEVLKDISEDDERKDLPEVMEAFKEAVRYNITNGRMNSGKASVAAYKLLVEPEDLTADNLRRAHLFGWCVELVEAAFLLLDDVMDNSETRRNLPCWHNKVGLRSVNDGCLLQEAPYPILKKHLSHLPCYLPVVELFHEATFKSYLAQTMDMLLVKDRKPDLPAFTMDRYKTLAKHKAKHFVRLITAGPFYLAGRYGPEEHAPLDAIAEAIGEYMQVQNDFLECFMDPSIKGKDGTDIREGKCTWLIARALQLATPSQRKALEENYGRPEPEAVLAVRNLYEEMDLPGAFKAYEEEKVGSITGLIDKLPEKTPKTLFLNLFGRLCQVESQSVQ